MTEETVVRRQCAMVGEVMVVSIPPGEKIFDLSGPREKLLGIVMDGQPVINGMTCYLSTNDYNAAKLAATIFNELLPN